jgi:hypothetical protein
LLTRYLRSKTEDGCFPVPVAGITKSNEILFHSRVKSLVANNAHMESEATCNLRKSISDSYIEKAEPKIIMGAQLNIKSDED